jgi:O-antigen/teichoic acid export membrane protein
VFKAIRLSILIAIIFLLILLIITPFVFPIIYGGEYKNSIPIASLLIISASISSINQMIGECLRGLGSLKISMVSEWTGAIFAIILLISFIEEYGLIGAALISILCSSIVLSISIYLLISKSRTRLKDIVIPSYDDIKYLVNIMIIK